MRSLWRLGLCLVLLTPVAAVGQSLQVEVTDGRLTVTAEDASVASLIEAVAREAELTLEHSESLEGLVTVRFRELPISEGLTRILGDRSYMLVYGVKVSQGPGGGAPVPVRLRFFETSTSEKPATGKDVVLDAERAALFETLEFHGDPWDKQDTMETLADAGDPAVARRLGQAGLADPDVDVRSAAVEALAILGGDTAAEMLETALRDAEPVIRQQAVVALEEIGGEAAVRGLTVALQDADAGLRLAVVDALGEVGGPGVLQLLGHAATDPDQEVRDSAEDWLAELRAESW